jgi:alpha-ketoglutarate-dependent taurine dioxygenase
VTGSEVPVRTRLFEGLKYPLVIEPDAPQAATPAALQDYIRANVDTLEALLLEKGALLFRGFGVASAGEFSAVVDSFPIEQMTYLGGNTPRHKVQGGIYTSTEINHRYKIKLHNELSFQENYPRNVFFFCETPAAAGGETILADVRDVYRAIPPEIVRTFEEKKVKYVRVFQQKRALTELLKKLVPTYFHLTWEQLFFTKDKARVEAACRELHIDFEWRRNGDLALTNVLPAVIPHPVTGEPLWFNHVPSLHFNRRTLGRPVYRTRKFLYRDERKLPTQVFYGDGSPIGMAELHPIYDALDRNTVKFPWERGDVLALDNRIIAHGRNPFTAPRKVLVSLAQPRSGARTAAAPA